MKRIIFFVKKYLKPFLYFGVYELFWLSLALIWYFFFPTILDYELSPWIPGKIMILEFLLVFTILIPVAGFFGYLLGGYLLAPLFLFIHKKILGKNLIYGIQEKSKTSEIRFFGKGFFPIMFALMLATNLASRIIGTDFVFQNLLSNDLLTLTGETDQLFNQILGLLIMLPVTFFISMFLFAAIWFLKNSGIIYSNEMKVKTISEPMVIKSVGGWFHTVIKGYAGIGVIVTYFSIITDTVETLIDTGEFIVAASILTLWIVLVIMMLLATIPGLIFNELIRHSSGDYVRKYGRKLGIVEFAEIKLTFKKIVASEDKAIKEAELGREPEYEVTKVFESSIDKFTAQDFESETPDHIHEFPYKEDEDKETQENNKS
ncbi:MAG: hypothetical protein KGD63_13685 [Candidatus Lokiarchaeota archaeon]|nr:hypothetical protein [Candidatus Lokiarchaeota archaeon]